MAGYNWGSSPLTRGKRSIFKARSTCAGLIPAHAGKTDRGRVEDLLATAHPRSRGENGDVRKATPWVQGSSPLTRGKRAETIAETLAERLIPAHAGKTRLSR